MRGTALLLLLLAGAGAAGAQSAGGLSPAKNWVLPLFTKDGYRSMTLSGDEVHPVSSDQIDVVNILITVFSGDASARRDSILVSSAASYFPKQHRAGGPAAVRLIRDDGEVTGENWTYEQNGEKISIRRNVRVVFNETIGNLIR